MLESLSPCTWAECCYFCLQSLCCCLRWRLLYRKGDGDTSSKSLQCIIDIVANPKNLDKHFFFKKDRYKTSKRKKMSITQFGHPNHLRGFSKFCAKSPKQMSDNLVSQIHRPQENHSIPLVWPKPRKHATQTYAWWRQADWTWRSHPDLIRPVEWRNLRYRMPWHCWSSVIACWLISSPSLHSAQESFAHLGAESRWTAGCLSPESSAWMKPRRWPSFQQEPTQAVCSRSSAVRSLQEGWFC